MAATAGLGVLLETKTEAAQQKKLPSRHAAAPPARTPPPSAQIISKATLTNAGAATAASKNDFVNDTSSSASRAPMSPVPAASSFLQRCFLCRREHADGRDIYIYRGDRAFCSEECRCRHILVVEDDDDCARVAAADRRRRRQAVVAGGFAL